MRSVVVAGFVAAACVAACGLSDDVARGTSGGGGGAGGQTTESPGGGGSTASTGGTAGAGGTAGSGGAPIDASRRRITIQANAAVPSGYSVHFSFDHQTLVTASASLERGDDVRVFREDGTPVELDRVLGLETAWNTTTTEIWFRTTAPIPAAGTDDAYFLYWGDPNAKSPPQDLRKVYLFWEDFEGSLDQWTSWKGTFGTIETDQFRSGGHALKAAETFQDEHWLTVTGLDESDVAVDSFWRLTTTSGVDVAQGMRAPPDGTVDDYETNFWSQGFAISKNIDDAWDELSPGPSGHDAPTDTWFRVTSAIVGSQFKVLVDGAQVNPDSGWTDTGGELTRGSVGFRTWKVPSGEGFWIDDVRVRKYVEPEPSLSLGATENAHYPL